MCENGTGKCLLASGNRGKLAEFKRLLGDDLPLRIDIPPWDRLGKGFDEVETGSSFFENALLKARWVARRTGCLALSDDSGLCVAALDGAPGIQSARFGGRTSDQDRCEYLLELLKDKGDRTAWFECCLVLYSPLSEKSFSFKGIVTGRIALAAAGTNGFGYDPVFVPEEGDGRTFAEMEAEEKAVLSHRARAVRRLREWLSRSETDFWV